MTVSTPGPTQVATFELSLFEVWPMVCHVARTTWVPFPTGTTKSKLCVDSVLRMSSKLQFGLGPTHTPDESPTGMLHVKPVPRLAQSASVVQTVVVGAAVHAVSRENSLSCFS